MGRLIDADKLNSYIKGKLGSMAEYELFATMIDMQPTAYDVDKVVEQITKKAIAEDEVLYVNGDEITYFVRLDEVNEIVKGGGQG